MILLQLIRELNARLMSNAIGSLLICALFISSIDLLSSPARQMAVAGQLAAMQRFSSS